MQAASRGLDSLLFAFGLTPRFLDPLVARGFARLDRAARRCLLCFLRHAAASSRPEGRNFRSLRR
jgi:hypothetical protein